MLERAAATWKVTSVKSPHLNDAVPVVAVIDLSITPTSNERQSVNIYIPQTPENLELVGTPVDRLPPISSAQRLATQIHIHGGAWRDPNLSARSIEATVAHAFKHPRRLIELVISINYTLSPFPTHPVAPYDPFKASQRDITREAIHPAHVGDVFKAFAFLRSLGLKDDSFILTGHSAGACLAFQSILAPPEYYGLKMSSPPVPMVVLGMNGLYDLIDLVDNLGESHQHLKDVYDNLIGIAFGTDRQVWKRASPAKFDVVDLERRAQEGLLPKLIVVDQSKEDELVPMNQCVKLLSHLSQVKGVTSVKIDRLTDRHAAPWQEGDMLWMAVLDALALTEST